MVSEQPAGGVLTFGVRSCEWECVSCVWLYLEGGWGCPREKDFLHRFYIACVRIGCSKDALWRLYGPALGVLRLFCGCSLDALTPEGGITPCGGRYGSRYSGRYSSCKQDSAGRKQDSSEHSQAGERGR